MSDPIHTSLQGDTGFTKNTHAHNMFLGRKQGKKYGISYGASIYAVLE